MRWRRFSLIAFLILAALVGGLGWLVYAPIRQERLNRALIAAIKQNDTKKALALLSEGADANSRDEPQQQISLWRLLWDRMRGKHPDSSTAPTALLLACTYENEVPDNAVDNAGMVKALLDKGAAVEEHNDPFLEMTPLLCALQWDKPEVSELLIERGANVNAIGPGGYTPIWYAVEYRNARLVRLLLNRRADVNHVPYNENTPLKEAKYMEDQQIIQMLKQAGAKE